jgi:hypothetical protein
VAIDYSKWTEADTRLVDEGHVTEADLNAWGGTATPTQVASLKSSGAQPGQGFFAPGDFSNIDPNAQVFQDSRAYDQQVAQTNAINDRYKSDLSWLDPSFQEQPAYLGPSQGSRTYADPALVAQQQQTYDQFGSYVGKDMGFASDARQVDQYNNWGGVAAGQGAPQFMGNSQQQGYIGEINGLQGPQWESPARQQQVYNQIQSIKNPEFRSDADQRQVMNDLGSIASSGGHQGIEFDDGSRQEEQYGHLKEIVDNGGLTAAERLARQKARLDEEQWIRGQREADQQQFAQRGMDGSGQQVLSLGQDRQAAASRISLADLQAAADAENRKLSAIGMASTAAGQMRGQTYDEQSYMASRGDNALIAKGSMANELRQDQYQESMGTADVELRRAGLAGEMANTLREDQFREQAYQTGYELDKVNSKANITSQMRQEDYMEKSYNDQRKLEGMKQQTNLANTLRSDQFNESVAQRNSDLTALQGQGTMATNMRNASSQESQFRASSADRFAEINNQTFNQADQANKSFQQSAWQSMQNNRQIVDLHTLDTKVGAAQGLQANDARTSKDITDYYQNQAQRDAEARDRANEQFRGISTSVITGGNTGSAASGAAADSKTAAGAGQLGNAGDAAADAAFGAPSKSTTGQTVGGTNQALVKQAYRPDPYADETRNRVY